VSEERKSRAMTRAWTFLTAALSRLGKLDRPRIRYCIRATVSAVLTFALGHLFSLPLHGLWAVLTAVVVSQVSAGASIRATTEYIIGTAGGAIYAGALATLLHPTTGVGMAVVLAIAVAPLTYAAARNSNLRVAPFTAVLVVLISAESAGSALQSAIDRSLDVALGCAVAVLVSLLVFPARAHVLGLESANTALKRMAAALPKLLDPSGTKIELLDNVRLQGEIGRAVNSFNVVADEAKRERAVNLVAEPDPAELARVLLRLRHTIVLVGRAAIAPLPEAIDERLHAPLAAVGAATSDFLRTAGSALVTRKPPPSLSTVESAYTGYAAAITGVRAAGLTQGLSTTEIEPIFALDFALQELLADMTELAQSVKEWAAARTR
jgi:uncharacterized membrane protein YccC